ncbi:unnamed protein product [Heterobilharzia americana]|nr:unnamed protein product [Heterobilharzia americana]
MLSPLEFDYIKNHELISIIPEYLDILNQWPNCLTMTNNPIISVYGKYFITPRLPNEVVMVFGGWCDGEGPTAAVQVYNPRANIWTLWTKTGHQSQLPANEWLSRLLQDSSDLTIVNESQTNSLQNAVDTVNIINNLRSSLPPDGVNLKQNKSVLFTDNIGVTENSGCLIGEIPRRVYAGCVLVDKRVYLVGGFDGSNALKSTLCYDFEIDSGWYEISCMYEKRYYVSVVYSNNHIYALGGHNGENQGRLDSAERYILNENLWQSITSMNRVRSDAAAAELNGKVYVAGGFEGRHYHDSVEYYEPVTNQWTLINRMNSPRGGISLIQHNGYLYAIGGNDGNNRLKSIEQYNPNDNKWEIVGQMNRCKSNLSSTVVNDEIYIFGGWSDEPEAGILDLVECYNTVSRKCHIVRSLIFPASATCACTLKDRDLVKKYIPIQTSSYSKPPFGTFLLHNTGQLLSPDQNISTGNFFSSQQNMNNNLQVNGNKTFTGIKIQSNQLYPDHQNEERMKLLDETISEYTIASVDHDDDDDDNGITGENRQNQLHLSATSSMIIPHRDININSSSNNNSSSINHRNIDENYILLQVSNSLTYNQSSWRKGSRKNCKRKTIRRGNKGLDIAKSIIDFYL